MVIQRDKPIAIWGWAAPGRAVMVQFGEEKAEATAVATLGAGPACVGLDTGSGKGGYLTALVLPDKHVYESR